MRTVGACGLAALLLLAGCGKQDMAEQRKARTWDRSTWFANHQTMQAPPAGTLAHGAPGEAVPAPARIDAALLGRGEVMFDANCAPCHGRSGDGQGMVVARGFPQPPALYAPDLLGASAAHLFDVITNGKGKMYGAADRVAPADRWAIVAWIRALQMAGAAPAAALAPQDLAMLGGAGPAR